ncbi:MAG: hypothetical protein ACQSGP_19065, partial [Frankia sp.]
GGCRLTFTADLVLPPEFRTKVLAGWHFHLDALAEALDGGRVDWPRWPLDRWERIHETYLAAELGSSADQTGRRA